MLHHLRSQVVAVPLALLLTVAAGSAMAAQLAVRVALSVRFVPTSGACGAQQAQSGFEVQCGRPVVVSPGGGGSPQSGLFPGSQGGSGGIGAGAGPGGGGLGTAGSETVAGTDATGAIVPDALTARANMRSHNAGEISSWRLVSLHNGAYVELTIAW